MSSNHIEMNTFLLGKLLSSTPASKAQNPPKHQFEMGQPPASANSGTSQ